MCSPRYNAKACEMYSKDLDMARVQCDKAEEGWALNGLGRTHEKLGRYEAALEMHSKGLEIAQQTNDKQQQARTYDQIAVVYESLEKLEEADQHREWSTAIGHYDPQEVEGHVGLVLHRTVWTGERHTTPQEQEASLRDQKRRVAVLRQAGDQQALVQALTDLAVIYETLNRHEVALVVQTCAHRHVHGHFADMCIDICRVVCIDLYGHVCAHMCLDVYREMNPDVCGHGPCTRMCAYMRTDMCADMRTDMYADTQEDTGDRNTNKRCQTAA